MPPSTDKNIFTLGVFTAPAFVPATFHEIVCVVPAVHDVAAFCVVI